MVLSKTVLQHHMTSFDVIQRHWRSPTLTNIIIHHSSEKIVHKDFKRLERSWKNLEVLVRTWKDLKGHGRTWKDLEGLEITWKDLKQFETIWKKWKKCKISKSVTEDRQTEWLTRSLLEACTSETSYSESGTWLLAHQHLSRLIFPCNFSDRGTSGNARQEIFIFIALNP